MNSSFKENLSVAPTEEKIKDTECKISKLNYRKVYSIAWKSHPMVQTWFYGRLLFIWNIVVMEKVKKLQYKRHNANKN